MKYLLTSKAISNGGDYLFTFRGIELAKKMLGKENIKYVNANIDEWKQLDLEEYDKVLVLGGPLYTNRLLEMDAFPILYEMKNRKKKIYFLGCGCYLNDDNGANVWNERFEPDVKELLDYVDYNGLLGCRDYLTSRILKNNGFSNVIMTGCPAWFSTDNKPFVINRTINKIVFSDAGLTKTKEIADEKYLQTISVLQFIQNKFKNSTIIYTFNNGIETKLSADFNKKVVAYLNEQNIKYFDLSNTSKKFELYNTCDLHIGYRLHSHIYSLTQGIPSILICEDARGIGFDKVFGLEVVKSYDDNFKEEYRSNSYLINQIEAIIDEEISTNFLRYKYVIKQFEYYHNENLGKFFSRLIES